MRCVGSKAFLHGFSLNIPIRIAYSSTEEIKETMTYANVTECIEKILEVTAYIDNNLSENDAIIKTLERLKVDYGIDWSELK